MFLILCFGMLPVIGQQTREQLYGLACAEPNQDERLTALMAGELDQEPLEKWLKRKTDARNDVRGWLVLANFYGKMNEFEEVKRCMDRAMALSGKEIRADLDLAAELLEGIDTTKVLVVLDQILEEGEETLEMKLLRAFALMRRSRDLEAAEICFELVEHLSDEVEVSVVEELFWLLKSVGFESEAYDFLEERAGDFKEDWRLRYLLGLALKDDGRVAESLSVFRSLLGAEGECERRLELHNKSRVHFRNDFRWPGSPILSIPKDLEMVGWSNEIFRIQRNGQEWGSEVFWHFLPDSAVEVRAMSLFHLVDAGGGDDTVVEGGERVELLKAFFRGEGEFEKAAEKILEAEPDAWKVRAIFLLKLNPKWYLSGERREWILSELGMMAERDAAFAIEMMHRYLQLGLMSRDVGEQWVLGVLKEKKSDKVREAASHLVGDEGGLSRKPRVLGAELGPIGEMLVARAKEGNEGVEPKWLTMVVRCLLREGRSKEAVQLLVRFSGSGVVKKRLRGTGYLRAGFDFYQGNGRFVVGEVGRVGPGLPPSFWDRVPSALREISWRQARSVEEVNAARLSEVWEQLETIDPRFRRPRNRLDHLPEYLDEIDDRGIRALFQWILFKDDFGEILEDLKASDDLRDKMLLSVVLEQKGEVLEAYRVMEGIGRDRLSVDQKTELDERLLLLGAMKVRVVDPEVDLKSAREAWKRLMEDAYGEKRHYLRELAELVGLEKPASPSVGLRQYYVEEPTKKELLNLMAAGNLKAAVTFVSERSQLVSRSEWYGTMRALSEVEEVEGVIRELKNELQGRRRLLGLARVASGAGLRKLAGEIYAKILVTIPDCFEAHLGVLNVQKVGEQDFGAALKGIRMATLRRGVRGLIEREDDWGGWHDGGETLVLGLLERLMEEAPQGEDLTFVARFVGRVDPRDSIGMAILKEREIMFGGWDNPEVIEAKKRHRERKRSIYELMLKRPNLVATGVAKLVANEVSWKLSEAELVRMIQDGLRCSSGIKDPLGFVKTSRRSSGEKVWGAEEFLRDRGRYEEILDEELMAQMKVHRPLRWRSLDLARRLVELGGEEARVEFRSWLEGEPLARSDDLGAWSRGEALRQLVDDILLYDPSGGEWMAELEEAWLAEIEPGNWNSGDELVVRWFRWRAGQNERLAGRFLVDYFEIGFGPKEAWPWLRELGARGVDQQTNTNVRLAIKFVDELTKTSSGRRALLRCLVVDDLGALFDGRQMARAYGSSNLAWRDGREKERYVRKLIEEVSKFTAGDGKQHEERCLVFLLRLLELPELEEIVGIEGLREELGEVPWPKGFGPWLGLATATTATEELVWMERISQERETFAKVGNADQIFVRWFLEARFSPDEFPEIWEEVESVLERYTK